MFWNLHIKALGLVLLLLSCRNSNQNKDMDLYFNKEIKNRMQIIAGLSGQADTLKTIVAALDKEVNNIILLSKDVENIGASVIRANDYFKTLALKYGINDSDFTKLSTGMHVNDIATILRQNELNLFNQLILKNNPSGLPLFTAQ